MRISDWSSDVCSSDLMVDVSTEANNRGAFLIQEHYCRQMDAPVYADICAALAMGLTRESRTGARVLDWPGEPTRDALPLRLMGGLHALVLAGADEELAAIFRGAGREIGRAHV